jgi:hypothetical protein
MGGILNMNCLVSHIDKAAAVMDRRYEALAPNTVRSSRNDQVLEAAPDRSDILRAARHKIGSRKSGGRAARIRTMAASGGIVTYLGMRAALLIVFTALSVTAFATTLQTVEVKELMPGSVVVTVRTPEDQLAASAFSLDLTSTEARTKVPAQDVSPAGALSPDLATSVLLCIDRSGSMHSVVPAIKSALKEVLAAARPDLRISVMSFGSDVSQPSPFSTDSAKTLEAVDAIRAETGHDGKTRLFDAIDNAMSRLAKDTSRGPKRLIVISDGKDEGSVVGRDVLASIVQQRAQVLDAIGIGQAAPKWSGGLAVLSKVTSGNFVLAANPAELSDAIKSDLGTAPAPAFNVSFRYPASSDAARATSAALEYRGPGAEPTVLPISVALAAPVPAVPVTPPAALSPAVQPKQVAAPAQAEPPLQAASSVLQKHTRNEWSITIGSIRINLKLGLGVLAALAAALAFIAYKISRKEPPVDREPPVAGVTRAPVARAGTRVSAMLSAPAPGRPTAVLVSEGARRQPVHFAIEKANVRVGADETNDLVVRGDDFVSRKHASIRFEAGSLYLSDLDSSNGTFRNGTRLGQAAVPLSPGDTVRFGRTTFEVRRADDTGAAAKSPEHERRVP